MYGVWPVGTLVLKVDWSQNVKAAIMFISTTNSSIGFVELLSSILSVFCYGDDKCLSDWRSFGPQLVVEFVAVITILDLSRFVQNRRTLYRIRTDTHFADGLLI